MKLSKLFHTLYATVMALPVIIIPIFAININQKSVEPISIEVQENDVVEFQQILDDSQFQKNSLGNYTLTNHVMSYEPLNYYNLLYRQNILVIGHEYIFKINVDLGASSTFCFYSDNLYEYFTTNTQYTFKFTARINHFYIRDFATSDWTQKELSNIELFDLTEMGIPNYSVSDFNNSFGQAYYNYSTTSQKVLINKPTLTTYDNTDIGSQFLYSLYKPVNDYFNFGEFFGLSGMYDWFQLNIFNGTAPLSFFIVFNVMIYWLFISLFWLIFDILIYVPMVIHKWLDKAEM